MDREQAHKLVDQLFDNIQLSPSVEHETEELKKELPKDKRVVRTPTSGDRVYLLDEVKKTRQWIASGEVLSGLGYDQSDVQDETDANLYKYSMGATLYKVE